MTAVCFVPISEGCLLNVEEMELEGGRCCARLSGSLSLVGLHTKRHFPDRVWSVGEAKRKKFRQRAGAA